MKSINLLSILLVLSLFISCGKQNIELKSPSESLKVKINNCEEGLNLALLKSKNNVLNIDLGKFVIEDDTLGSSYKVENVNYSSKDEVWKTVYGERSSVRDNFNEIELTLKDRNFSGKTVRLICRLYDEGVAFRYIFDTLSIGDAVLNKELTSFKFDNDYEAWVTDKAQGRYEKKNISKIKRACERPLVIEQNDTSYLAIGEALLVDFARMKFICNEQTENSLQVILDRNVDIKAAGYKTPWRYVMVANSPGKLLENNYFIENLNDPVKIENTSWIKPGKVIREVSLTTKGGMACVDFAARHNLQYVEFDAGWYGNEYSDLSDATTITVDPRRSPGPLELHKVINYANEKGIGIIVYVNRRALEKQLDEILPLYKSWGIKGMKYGFVNVGSQRWTSWLHDALRKAANHQLMVDVHDEYRPTGYSRTFPNLMTQEGIRGDEESPSTEHTLITAFTRMIAGAGDNTNCYQAERVTEKMGGKAAQMAKAVILYSPWQFVYWYDRPEGSPHKKGGAGASKGIIRESAELEFYDAVPTVWDETKVLEGKIGEYATIARRKGDSWYIGALVANQTRELKIPLTFLDKNSYYEAVIYQQNEDDLINKRVKIETITVNKQSIVTKKLLNDSGIAIILRKV